MTVKAYLHEIKDLNATINQNLQRLYELRESMSCIGNHCSEEWVQHARDADRVSALVAKIVDLESETDTLVDTYTNKVSKISDIAMPILDEIDYAIMSDIYFRSHTISNIAERQGLCSSSIKKRHKNLLLRLENEIKTQNIVF